MILSWVLVPVTGCFRASVEDHARWCPDSGLRLLVTTVCRAYLALIYACLRVRARRLFVRASLVLFCLLTWSASLDFFAASAYALVEILRWFFVRVTPVLFYTRWFTLLWYCATVSRFSQDALSWAFRSSYARPIFFTKYKLEDVTPSKPFRDSKVDVRGCNVPENFMAIVEGRTDGVLPRSRVRFSFKSKLDTLMSVGFWLHARLARPYTE